MAALVKYKYLGLSSVVEVDYPTPQVKLDLWGQTSGTYTGLDRFGRVVNHPWINYGASPDEDVARIQHGYDRNSNRLWRQNDAARELSKKFDQQYTYDGLNRLTDARTGLLNGSHVIPSGSDTTFQQEWSLDYVGNWSCFKQDDDGGGTFDLEQTRVANPVNEITNISATTGPTWATPVYDPAGNTTNFPKPAAPTESFTAVYDAWNRMVRVTDDEDDDATVQENVYDGRNFRIVKKTYEAGVLDETHHIYYTSSWQAIEERLGTNPDSADPVQQYVWGVRYIDDLVMRYMDTSEPPDGTLDERLYALQDPNWNVTTIIDDSGDVLERYEYDGYGVTIVLTPIFGDRLLSLYSWVLLRSGSLWDVATDLLILRYRYLHPSVGRFLTHDLVGYKAGVNLYQYVGSSPTTFEDPWGLKEYQAGESFIPNNPGHDIPSFMDRPDWPNAGSEGIQPGSIGPHVTPSIPTNWGSGVGKMHSMEHTLVLCYPVGLPATYYAKSIYLNGLKRFRNFSPNSWNTLSIAGTRATFHLRGLAGMGGLGTTGLPNKLPVELHADDASQKVYGVTLKGHVLVGVRVWTAEAIPNSNPPKVTVRTYSWERTALPTSPLAANLLSHGAWQAGQQAQKESWQEYLINIRDHEAKDFQAKPVAQIINGKLAHHLAIKLEMNEFNYTDSANPLRKELPAHLQ